MNILKISGVANTIKTSHAAVKSAKQQAKFLEAQDIMLRKIHLQELAKSGRTGELCENLRIMAVSEMAKKSPIMKIFTAAAGAKEKIAAVFGKK